MATAKMNVYPYVHLSLKGELESVKAQAYPGDDQVGDYGIYIHLPMVEYEVSIPDEDALRNAAVQLIDAKMGEARAKFMAQQTLMQSVRNDLLRLEAPDILDATPKPERDTMQQFGDDNHHDGDIPF